MFSIAFFGTRTKFLIMQKGNYSFAVIFLLGLLITTNTQVAGQDKVLNKLPDKFNIERQIVQIAVSIDAPAIHFKGSSYEGNRSSRSLGGRVGLSYFNFPRKTPTAGLLQNSHDKNSPGNIINYTRHFGFGIGFFMVEKGGKDKYDFGSGNSGTDIYHITYAEIPLLARYQFFTSSGGKVYLQVGPYYAIALSGKGSYAGLGTQKLKFGNRNGDFRRGDAGLQPGIGYEFPHSPLSVGIINDLGLRNIVPGGGYGKNTTLTFGLQAGYTL
jgi:Outer membrane protein beta-barrel domain